jgi:hypothetical protein
MMPSQFPENFYQDPYGLDRYVVQEKILFEWRAASKLDRKRTRSDFVQLILFFVIVGLILLLLNELLLLVVFITGVFLYVMTILSRPAFLESQITTIGIKVEDKYYFWPQIAQFWFETKMGTKILVFRYVGTTVRNVRLAIQSDDEEEMKTILGKYILCKKPTLTTFEARIDKTVQTLSTFFDYI